MLALPNKPANVASNKAHTFNLLRLPILFLFRTSDLSSADTMAQPAVLGTTLDESVRDIHKDLVRKYKRHSETIESIWRSMGRRERSQCMKDTAKDGKVPRHPSDPSMGNVSKFIPEWNLRDVTNDPEYLIKLLHFRGTTSLVDQYMAGLNDTPGDHGYILDAVNTRDPRHTS